MIALSVEANHAVLLHRLPTQPGRKALAPDQFGHPLEPALVQDFPVDKPAAGGVARKLQQNRIRELLVAAGQVRDTVALAT